MILFITLRINALDSSNWNEGAQSFPTEFGGMGGGAGEPGWWEGHTWMDRQTKDGDRDGTTQSPKLQIAVCPI